MKIFNIAIPVLFTFFLLNSTNEVNHNYGYEITPAKTIDIAEAATGTKKTGILSGEQDFSNCNICSDCTECPGSGGGCIGATITISSLFCPYESPQGTLAFPGNSQYICSLTQTGPYTFYVEFDAVAYSCSLPDTPYQFNIPMTYSYFCNWTGGGVLSGNLHFIIC